MRQTTGRVTGVAESDWILYQGNCVVAGFGRESFDKIASEYNWTNKGLSKGWFGTCIPFWRVIFLLDRGWIDVCYDWLGLISV